MNIRDGAHNWHSTQAERHAPLPCDQVLPDADSVVHRAIDVDASPPVVFRWLCQLKVAPYSYDLIDNFGRRSPRELTPGAERLEVGQRFISIFRLTGFEPDRQITILTRIGPTAVTYDVSPRGDGSRLYARIRIRGRMAPALPYLDLPMMRKQLLTLKELAEASRPAA
ncbi:MAG: hypothetical protein QOD53_258 [Thermoleophilaceae bacterium]|nr:hypothetical protein [Thermoleophilaceae bacterium]